MTFYNVLSALLFLGALRVLLIAFEFSNWSNLFASLCLTVLVFNDMLATSHTVETTEEVKYTMSLMIIDLVNFLLLALAMIVISPTSNLFNVPLPRLAGLLTANSFWLLLTWYWIFLMTWTHLSRKCTGGQHFRVRFWQLTVGVAFLVEWVLAAARLSNAARIGAAAVSTYVVLYLVMIRRLAWRPAS